MKGRKQQSAMCPHYIVGVVVLALFAIAMVLQIRPHDQAALPVIQSEIPETADMPRPQQPPVNCAKVPCIALTFDDGPNPITTPQILTTLQQFKAHATFFVVGQRAATMPSLLQRMYISGDEIGNHSWSHPDLTTLSPDQVRDQVQRTQMAVAAAGVPAPSLFRPPYGTLNAQVRSEIPLTLAMWNIDPVDWKTKDPNAVVSNVMSAAKPGRVVDMHDIDPQTVAALPVLLQALKSQNYHMVTMSQLLDLAPGQRGEFFGR